MVRCSMPLVAMFGALVAVHIVTATKPVNAAPPTVKTSSDQRLLLVSGRHRDDVLTAVNEAAADGYRLVALTPTWHELGITGLGCLLERSADEPAANYRYAFPQGSDARLLDKEIRELAGRGFRIVSHGLLERWADYLIASGTQSLIVMERSTPTSVGEYNVLAAYSRKRLLDRMTERCESGYRFVGLLASPKGWMMTVWERMPSTDVPDEELSCNGRYDYVDKMSRRALRKQLIERGAQGFRLLAIAMPGFRGGSYGAVLERLQGETQTYSYRFPFVDDEDAQDALDTMNNWAAEGFRLHAGSSSAFMVMEQDPAALNETKYKLIGTSSAHDLLDALSEALADGFRIVRFMGSDAVLLER